MLNGNGTRHGLKAYPDAPPDVEMKAFDRLPWEIRQAINYFPLRASAVELAQKIDEGVPVDEILYRYRENRRRIPLSFVRREA